MAAGTKWKKLRKSLNDGQNDDFGQGKLYDVQRCELSGPARLAERHLTTKTTLLKPTQEILPYAHFEPSAIMTASF